jgi:hypothetical protein
MTTALPITGKVDMNTIFEYEFSEGDPHVVLERRFKPPSFFVTGGPPGFVTKNRPGVVIELVDGSGTRRFYRHVPRWNWVLRKYRWLPSPRRIRHYLREDLGKQQGDPILIKRNQYELTRAPEKYGPALVWMYWLPYESKRFSPERRDALHGVRPDYDDTPLSSMKEGDFGKRGNVSQLIDVYDISNGDEASVYEFGAGGGTFVHVHGLMNVVDGKVTVHIF